MDMTLRLPKSHLSLSRQRKSLTACLVSLQEQNQMHSQQTLFPPDFLSVCAHACQHAFKHMLLLQIFVCKHACGSQRSTSGIFLSRSPPYLFEMRSPTEPGAHPFGSHGWPASFRALPVFPVLGRQVPASRPGTFAGVLVD